MLLRWPLERLRERAREKERKKRESAFERGEKSANPQLIAQHTPCYRSHAEPPPAGGAVVGAVVGAAGGGGGVARSV